MATRKTGSRQRRDCRDDEEEYRGPDVIVSLKTVDFHGTAGKQRKTRCARCGSSFVCVVCPVHWPIESVALCCFTCGRVIEYVDGLLLLSVKQAITEHQGRPWVVRRGIGLDAEKLPSGFEVAKELVQMGIDGGLTDKDIAEAMGIPEDSVAVIANQLGKS